MTELSSAEIGGQWMLGDLKRGFTCFRGRDLLPRVCLFCSILEWTTSSCDFPCEHPDIDALLLPPPANLNEQI